MIDELLVRSMAFGAQDLFRAVRRLESCELNGGELWELDEAESELVDARSSVEGVISSILNTFGVHADVELHRITTYGVE